MDSLTHALFPFLFGKFFKRSRSECAALALGGFAPDLDVFISWIPHFIQTTLPLYHRGITHTIIFGFVTAAIVLYIASRGYFRKVMQNSSHIGVALSMTGSLLIFAYIGVLSHLFLDGLTTYGIPLLYPLTSQRYSAELFFYIDQYLFLTSFVLIAYMAFLRNRIKLPPAERSNVMQSIYVKQFYVFIAVILLLGGLRYYEKSTAAEQFGLTIQSAYPTSSPFEWNVYDRAGGKVYVYDTLKNTTVSEYAFNGTTPNRMHWMSQAD